VDAGVSQDELRQILGQLRSLTRTVPPAPSYPASTSAYTYPPQPTYNRPFQSTYPPAPQPPPPSTYTHQSEPVKSEPVDLSALLTSASVSSSAAAAPAMPPSSITNLFNALLKAGVVSSDNTTGGAGSTNSEEYPTPPPPGLNRDSTRAYRKAVLSANIKLTTTDITRYSIWCLRSMFC
jgi:pre-mRNA cleavage complex 2 protein Pcf11